MLKLMSPNMVRNLTSYTLSVNSLQSFAPDRVACDEALLFVAVLQIIMHIFL